MLTGNSVDTLFSEPNPTEAGEGADLPPTTTSSQQQQVSLHQDPIGDPFMDPLPASSEGTPSRQSVLSSLERRSPPTIPRRSQPSSAANNPTDQSTTTTASAIPVTMKVEQFYRGNGAIVSKTYFTVAVRTAAVVRYPPAVIPDVAESVPPHLRALDRGLRQQEWETDRDINRPRRYSEAVTLRELLTYQFPHRIIPPLPEKSLLQTVETSLNTPDEQVQQAVLLHYFLTRLTEMSDVMSLSTYVHRFAMEERAEFDLTVAEMQKQIEKYRSCNQVVDEFSGNKPEYTSTVSAVTSTGSSVVRSIVDFFSSNSAKQAGGPTVVFGAEDAEERVVQQEIDAWNAVSLMVTKKKESLRNLYKTCRTHLEGLSRRSLNGIEMANSIMGLAADEQPSNLSPSEDGKPSGPAFKSGLEGWGRVLKERLETEQAERRSLFAAVVGGFKCESLMAQAVLYRIGSILALYAYVQRSPAYQRHSPAYKEALHTATAISQAVRKEFEEVVWPAMTARQQHITARCLVGWNGQVWKKLLAIEQQNPLQHYLNALPPSIAEKAAAEAESAAAPSNA